MRKSEQPGGEHRHGIKRGLRAAALLLAVTIGSGACVGSKSEGDTQSDWIARSVDTTVQPEISGHDYYTSAERNNSIQTFVQDAGEKLGNGISTRQFGRFDFFALDGAKFASQHLDVSGWGWLSNIPKSDNDPQNVSVLVWRNSDGTYDYGKGIQALKINISDDRLSINIESPTINSVVYPDARQGEAWKVEISDGPATSSTYDVAQDKGSIAAGVIDHTALSTADQYMRSLDLYPNK